MHLCQRREVPEGNVRPRRTLGSGAARRPAAAAALAGHTAEEAALRAKHSLIIAQPLLRDLAGLGTGTMGRIQVALECRQRLPAVTKLRVASGAAGYGAVDS